MALRKPVDGDPQIDADAKEFLEQIKIYANDRKIHNNLGFELLADLQMWLKIAEAKFANQLHIRTTQKIGALKGEMRKKDLMA